MSGLKTIFLLSGTALLLGLGSAAVSEVTGGLYAFDFGGVGGSYNVEGYVENTSPMDYQTYQVMGISGSAWVGGSPWDEESNSGSVPPLDTKRIDLIPRLNGTFPTPPISGVDFCLTASYAKNTTYVALDWDCDVS